MSTGNPQDIHDGLLLGISGKRKKITCVKLSGCVSDATLATWARDALAVSSGALVAENCQPVTSVFMARHMKVYFTINPASRSTLVYEECKVRDTHALPRLCLAIILFVPNAPHSCQDILYRMGPTPHKTNHYKFHTNVDIEHIRSNAKERASSVQSLGIKNRF